MSAVADFLVTAGNFVYSPYVSVLSSVSQTPWADTGKFLAEFAIAVLTSAGSVEELKVSVVKPSTDVIAGLKRKVAVNYAAALENESVVVTAFKKYHKQVCDIEEQHQQKVEAILERKLWWWVILALVLMLLGLTQIVGPFSALLLWPLLSMRNDLKKVNREAENAASALERVCDDALEIQEEELKRKENASLGRIP